MPARALNEKQHPAKRVFQAIRIEVNEELIRLRQTVKDIVHSLNSQGRLAIITFHSLEDKIIKHTYEELEGRCTCPKDFPVCVCGCKSYGKIITKKPIVCDENELQDNPRARSAKLRVFEKYNEKRWEHMPARKSYGYNYYESGSAARKIDYTYDEKRQKEKCK